MGKGKERRERERERVRQCRHLRHDGERGIEIARCYLFNTLHTHTRKHNHIAKNEGEGEREEGEELFVVDAVVGVMAVVGDKRGGQDCFGIYVSQGGWKT
jgi:hypothetical protein